MILQCEPSQKRFKYLYKSLPAYVIVFILGFSWSSKSVKNRDKSRAKIKVQVSVQNRLY